MLCDQFLVSGSARRRPFGSAQVLVPRDSVMNFNPGNTCLWGDACAYAQQHTCCAGCMTPVAVKISSHHREVYPPLTVCWWSEDLYWFSSAARTGTPWYYRTVYHTVCQEHFRMHKCMSCRHRVGAHVRAGCSEYAPTSFLFDSMLSAKVSEVVAHSLRHSLSSLLVPVWLDFLSMLSSTSSTCRRWSVLHAKAQRLSCQRL